MILQNVKQCTKTLHKLASTLTGMDVKNSFFSEMLPYIFRKVIQPRKFCNMFKNKENEAVKKMLKSRLNNPLIYSHHFVMFSMTIELRLSNDLLKKNNSGIIFILTMQFLINIFENSTSILTNVYTREENEG